MEFFDYKFLILLGLSLVVYFIYREVDRLHSKMEMLEREIKVNRGILNNQIKDDKPPDTTTYVENCPIEIKMLEQNFNQGNSPVHNQGNSPVSPPKIISIDILPSDNIEYQQYSHTQIPIDIYNRLNQALCVSDSIESPCESMGSKHLAIYSNDNDQYDETQNSLLESIESHKNNQLFTHNDDLSIGKTNTDVNDIINMVTSVGSDEKSNSTISEARLEKKKLSELKKIAESKNISLNKKIGGQQKSKNKQELIKEILNKK